jgi:putative tricarboxylic transport membrane protein
VFGMLGLVLKRLNLPIVPIILGMVLGNIMETKFRSSLPRIESPLDFISRPIASIVFAVIVVVVVAHVWTLVRARVRRARAGKPGEGEAKAETP